MELNVTNANPVKVSDAIFAAPFREDLVHQVVVAYMAAGRAGTKAQKTRSEVSGGGRKPYRQKGTGNARAGSTRSPIWRHGGVTFAAKPRSHAQKVNRKMYRGAICSILAELNRQERLRVVSEFGFDKPGTRGLLDKLGELNVSGRCVMVVDDPSEALYLSARNLRSLQVVDVAAMDPVSLVGAEQVIMTVAAVKQIEEWLA